MLRIVFSTDPNWAGLEIICHLYISAPNDCSKSFLCASWSRERHFSLFVRGKVIIWTNIGYLWYILSTRNYDWWRLEPLISFWRGGEKPPVEIFFDRGDAFKTFTALNDPVITKNIFIKCTQLAVINGFRCDGGDPPYLFIALSVPSETISRPTFKILYYPEFVGDLEPQIKYTVSIKSLFVGVPMYSVSKNDITELRNISITSIADFCNIARVFLQHNLHKNNIQEYSELLFPVHGLLNTLDLCNPWF